MYKCYFHQIFYDVEKILIIILPSSDIPYHLLNLVNYTLRSL